MRHWAAILLCAGLGVLGVLQLRGNGGAIGWVLAPFLVLGARFALRPRPGELALVAKLVAGIVAAIAVIAAAMFAAWESEEVVVVRYSDGQGGQRASRLWVIDLDGNPCVAMSSEKTRVASMRANPKVELERAGQRECRTAVVVAESEGTPEELRTAERLFAEKYGIRPRFTEALAVLFGADPNAERILIRLLPCS